MANYGTKLARIDVLIGGADQARKQVDEMRDEWAKLGKEVQAARKKMEAAVNTVGYANSKTAYTDAVKQQKQLGKLIHETERNIDTVEKYLLDVSGQTLRNLNNARKGLNQMLLGINPKNFESLQTVRDYIKQVNDEIQRRKGNLIEFSDIMGNIGTVSDKSLGMAKQRLQELVSSTEQNTAEIKKYLDQLKKVEDEEQRRISSKAGRIMGNLDGSSVSEIQEAIKVTTQLRDAQKLGSQEWEIYNDEIEKAQKYLKDFNELGKQLAMSDRMQDLAKASTASLAELKKYWQEQVDGAQRGSQELAEYEKHLKDVAKEEERRSSKKSLNVFNNLSGSSVSEIQDAIKATKQLRDAQQLGSKQWEIYNSFIQRGQDYLTKFEETTKRTLIAEKMKDIGNISTASLAEVKKYWQEQIDGAEQSSQHLKQYKQYLEDITKEEQHRLSQRAQSTLGKVQGGTFDATIGDTKEAIKLLEQYKQQLNVSNTQGIKDVDEAIKSLNESIKKASDNTASLEDALDMTKKVGEGEFEGTIEDLEKLKKTLEEYQKKLKVTDTEGLKKIKKALQQIEEKQKDVTKETVKLDDVILNLRTKPLEELQKAAAQLQEELTSAERGTKEYIETSQKLRMVNSQIQKVKRSWEEHDNQIEATMKRLASYVLIYAGFNEVWGRIKELYQANLELSDSMADIQKTTGLSAQSVAELSKEIDGIDTRTAQIQLYELAASAGQAGLKSKEDILGFVRAADQLTIALNELGEDGVNTLLKISNLTKEGQILGTEKALLAIGSSINELSAASSATAGPITDIISRIGSIAKVSRLSMADMAALGARLDELGQEVEVSGTALTTFITALQTNTRTIAMATGLDDKELDRLLEAGNTMEAIVMVLEKLGQMGKEGGMKAMAPILKEFGSEGERLNRVISALSQDTDILRARVDLSRKAYEEATSVTKEAMVKQESAIGLLNRLGNELKETFVNSGAVEKLKEFLLSLIDFVHWLDSGMKSAERFKIGIVSLTTGLVAFGVAAKAAGAALFTAKTYTDLWTKGWASLNVAMKKNVIGLVTSAIVTLGVAVYSIMTKISDVAKAIADYNRELETERLRVDALFEGAKKDIKDKETRRDLINEINSRYGEYLGFMLKETDSNDKLAAAQELVNSKIRERMALQLKEKLQEQATKRTAGRVSEALGSIRSGLEHTRGISDVRAEEAQRIVQEIVNKDITLPMQEILKKVSEALSDKFSTKYNKYTYQEFFKISDGVREYISALKDYDKEIAISIKETEEKMAKAREDVVKANYKLLNELTAEWNDLQKIKTDSLDDKQLNAHNKELKKVADEYIKIATGQISAVSGEQKKQLQNYVRFYEDAISQIEKRSKKREPNIWGVGKTIDDASVDQLVAKYEQLFKERTTMRADADYSTAYAKEFKDRSEAMEWYLKKLKEIESQLNKMGYDKNGNFLKERKGRGRGEDKRMREDMTAALSALETYFVQQQTLIKENRVKENITEEEMFRQLENTEFRHLDARIKLRKTFLGDMKALSKEEIKTYGLEEKDLSKLSKELLAKGQGMRDGIRLKLTEDELKMREDLLKHQAAIRKILLDNDYTGQVDKEFMGAIDKLELLFGKQEEITEEAGVRRMAILRSFASESYLIDAEELKKRMEEQSEFSEWRIGKTEEDYQALLFMLQKYNDDYESAENRAIERRKRIANKKWEKSGQKDDWQKKTDNAQSDVGLMETASGLGLASESMVEDAKLKLYKLRIQASEAYLQQMQKEMQMEVEKAYNEKLIADEEYEKQKERGEVDSETKQKALDANAAYESAKRMQIQMTLDARQKLNEAMIDLDNQEMAIQQRKLETLKGYTDAIVDFSGQMGEAAFGEVEDRKAAAKQLVQTTMKLTKDLIMQRIQELVMKKALKKDEVAIEEQGNDSIIRSSGNAIISNLIASEKGMGGKITAGIAGGSAKIIELLGPWGIPLIAVISAALNGLLGLAMGAFSKSKQEVAAVTGASASNKGRVAAGMLTYAKGDYPVLGNDGQIYNASYQKELKTGVYGGGAHFGIFSEKKPEMIVDGDTTQKLILNYPHIYDSILTIARHGRLQQAAMPTYATGSYPMPQQVAVPTGEGEIQGMESSTQMQQTLVQLSAAVVALTDRLNKPISATMDPYQANKTLKKTDKFMNKRGLV